MHLKHLRSLVATNNRIRSLASIVQMQGLLHLNVSKNRLNRFDFGELDSVHPQLETLDVSYNHLESMENLELFQSLYSLIASIV
jgi:Leucine-rich repeat (LRR) protein